MWTSYFTQFLRLVMIGVVLTVSRELDGRRPTPSNPLPPTEEAETFSTLSPQRREWAERSVAGYIRQQEKKWRRWDEAMFKARYSRDS